MVLTLCFGRLFGLIGPPGGVDHGLQQFQLLLEGAVQLVDGRNHGIGVDIGQALRQLLFALLGLGIVYNDFDGGVFLTGSPPGMSVCCNLLRNACLI